MKIFTFHYDVVEQKLDFSQADTKTIVARDRTAKVLAVDLQEAKSIFYHFTENSVATEFLPKQDFPVDPWGPNEDYGVLVQDIQEDDCATTQRPGKYLTELIEQVDVHHKAVRTVYDDLASICWQDGGTLAYFGYDDGYPADYWADHHPAPYDDRTPYTSLRTFIPYLKQHTTDEHFLYLLNNPVWCVIEDGKQEREAFNKLLGDIVINL